MPEPTIAQAQAVIQLVAEYNVAMANLLKQLNELEKPLRAEFDNARKSINDKYRIECNELTYKKNLRLGEIALEGSEND